MGGGAIFFKGTVKFFFYKGKNYLFWFSAKKINCNLKRPISMGKGQYSLKDLWSFFSIGVKMTFFDFLQKKLSVI